MADLDDLLHGLGSGPELPLAPASDVLARGDRRRRHRQRLAAGCGALLVLAAGGVLHLAADGPGGSDSLRPDPVASPEVTATPTAAPTAAPTAEPTTGPGSSPSAATRAPGPVLGSDRVTLEGVGPVRIGMTYAELEVALGSSVRIDDELSPTGQCVYPVLTAAQGGADLRLVGSRGRVVAVYVNDPGRPTQSGVEVGDPESRVRAVYGDALVETLPGGPEDGQPYRYLSVAPAGSPNQLSLRMGTVDAPAGPVAAYAVGRTGWTQLFEGCA